MELLPLEIRLLLVSFLDYRTRRFFRLASTQWFKHIKYNNFVVHFVTKEQLPHIVRRLERYDFPLHLTFRKVKSEFTEEEYKQIGRLTQLTLLNFPPNFTTGRGPAEIFWPLTNLTNLENHPCLESPVMQRLTKTKELSLTTQHDKDLDLNQYSQVESLTWRFNIFQPPAADPLMNLPHTTKITSLELDPIPRTLIDENNLLKFSNLKKLKFGTLSSGTSQTKPFQLPHLPYLETFSCEFLNIGSLATVSATLTALVLITQKIDFEELAKLSNLRHVTIKFCRENEYTPQHFQFLTALTNLESFKWKPYKEIPWGEELEFISPQNLTALKLLTGGYNVVHVDPYLSKFGKLQSLEMSSYDPYAPNSLSALANLTRLFIANVVPEKFPILEKLTKLRSLELEVSQHSTLTENDKLYLDKLLSLEEFSLKIDGDDFCHVDVASIQHLPLKSITVSWPVGNDFLEILASINTLEKIELSNGSLITDSGISALSILTNLVNLWLKEANQVTGETLTKLTSLQDLFVRGTKVDTDATKKLTQILPRLYRSSISRF